MSVPQLIGMLQGLPPALKDQVVEYARAIESAADDIFQDAGIQRDSALTSKLVIIAGVRKLYAIVESNYWIIEHAGMLLERTTQSSAVRVGSTDFSRGGEYHRTLERMRLEIGNAIEDAGLAPYVYQSGYKEVVRELANGH